MLSKLHRYPTPVITSERGTIIGLCALALALTALFLGGHTLVLTGDEPRYLMYAASILKYGRYVMTLPEWQPLYLRVTHSVASGLPVGGDGNVLMNGVYLPTLLAPIANLFSLPGLRGATLLAGFAGLFYLFRLCRRFSTPGTALFVTAIAGFTIPLLPYLHLFYMETFLFALICCGWDRLQEKDRGWGGDLITAFVLLAVPFVQMRGSVVAASLYSLLCWQLYSRGLVKRAALFVILAAAALGLLITLNLSIYGAITGPVNTARPPAPSEWLSVITMQLFNVRHGLLAYAPIWLLGFAGLWVGVVRGPAIPRQALVLAIVAVVTSVGINPGECWPARFWVLSVPMLTIGFCAWWVAARPALRLVAVFLLGFTLVNTCIYVISPNAFLENRQTTTTYQMLFDKLRTFNFGLMLPVEVNDAPNSAAARDLAIGSGLFIFLMALAAQQRRLAYAVPAILLIVATLDLSRVRVIHPSEYSVTIDHSRIRIEPKISVAVAYIQFGHNTQTWFAPPEWQRFTVAVSGTGGQPTSTTLSANQVIAASCSKSITSIEIQSPGGFDIGSEANYRFQAYESKSLLRRWLTELRRAC